MAPATSTRRRTAALRQTRSQMTLDSLVAPPPVTPAAREAARTLAEPAVTTHAATAPTLASVATPRVPASAAPAGGSLDELLTGTWRSLGAQRVATCLVCGGAMRRAEGARGGQCASCGSSLS